MERTTARPLSAVLCDVIKSNRSEVLLTGKRWCVLPESEERSKACLDVYDVHGILDFLNGVILHNERLKEGLERMLNYDQVQEEVYNVIYRQLPPEGQSEDGDMNVYFYDEEGAIIGNLQQEWKAEDEEVEDEEEPEPATPMMVAQLKIFLATQEQIEESSECGICTGEICLDERLRALPTCRHSFHAECIESWLKRNNSCPFCRTPIPDVDLRNARCFDSVTDLIQMLAKLNRRSKKLKHQFAALKDTLTSNKKDEATS